VSVQQSPAVLNLVVLRLGFCQNVKAVQRDGRAVGDEVRDGFHDIPRVFEPRQPRQNAPLQTHVRQNGVL